MSIYQTIGLMSGTSMDGIDVALIETDGMCHLVNKGSTFLPYVKEFQILLKASEFFLGKSSGRINKSSKLFQQAFIEYLTTRMSLNQSESENIQKNCKYYLQKFETEELSITAIEQHSTYLHYLAVTKLLDKLNLKSSQIDLIGYHGQTLFHDPKNKITIQLGNAAQLAALTHIDVVNNFRQNDINHGGQGAPLAPLYHQILALRDKVTPCVVVNCGGISNLTIINGNEHEDILAYDAGPGNCLLDNFVRQKTQGEKMMDVNGQYAFAGAVHDRLIKLLETESCIKHGKNYYQQIPPKSLDANDFSLPKEFAAVSLFDGAATLAYFTAKCLVDSLALTQTCIPNYWILVGGGFHNPAIVAALKSVLETKRAIAIKVLLAKELGWDIDGLEAEIFAYLAVRSVKNLPLSLPKTTGVSIPVSGGDFLKFNVRNSSG